MKIALIGATGFVGAHILQEALERGQEVTAIVRDPAKLTQSNDKLTVVKGDIKKVDELASLLAEADVVVSSFNPGWDNPNIYDDFVAGSKDIEAAVVKSGVKRLITIGGAGSLFIDGKQLVDSPQFPAEYKAGATAARDYLNIIKENTVLDWTFFSPAIEMHPGISTGRTGQYRLGTESPVFGEDHRSVLSVQDLAVVILDEVEKKQFIKQRFTAAY